MYDQNSHDIYKSKVGIEPTFFGKVLTFFALAVFVSAAGAFVAMKYFMGYFVANPALMWVVFIAEIVLIFTSGMWSQKVPLNRFLFALFAFISGVSIAPLLSVVAASPGGTEIITKALLVTGFMFTAAGLFGWTTRMDLSGMRGFLMIGLIGMIITGIISFFIPWSSQTEMIYSGIGVLLFAGFAVYDFQKIKHYPEDRYIDAALNLYLDIFNLFLFVLRFLNSSRD